MTVMLQPVTAASMSICQVMRGKGHRAKLAQIGVIRVPSQAELVASDNHPCQDKIECFHCT